MFHVKHFEMEWRDFMKEQLRVYLFVILGMICFCTNYLAGILFFGPGRIRIDFMLVLACIFWVLAAVYHFEARSDGAEPTKAVKQKVLHNGQRWTEFNCFQVQMDMEEVARTQDHMLQCKVAAHVENWLEDWKDKDNNLRLSVAALAETGKNKTEASGQLDKDCPIAVGSKETFYWTVQVGEKTERLLLTVTVESAEKRYQQQYEFYPAHQK